MLVLPYVFMYLGIYGECAECGKNVAISIADDNKASVSLYALYVHTNCICQVLLQELGQTFSSAQPAPCTRSLP